ncbi:MAG: hypothetical protein KJS98_14555, partial [Nitrospirae bacterium]|nr:hypothetical protein [Nitrospirota bacterium]
MRKKAGFVGSGVIMAGAVLSLAGCAKHADFVELRDHLATVSKSQDQDQKRLDALQRRLESLERMKDSESVRPKLDEMSARIQKLESRLAKSDETAGIPVVPKVEPALGEPARPSKPQKPASSSDMPTMMPGVPTIT